MKIPTITLSSLKRAGYHLNKNDQLEKKPIPQIITKRVKGKKRNKISYGRTYVNDKDPRPVPETKFVLDKSRKIYAFDVIPFGAPRMTQSDKWKTDPNHPSPLRRKREVVVMYHDFRSRLVNQAKKMGYVLGRSLEAIFLIPMPDSWSDKKKRENNGMPCFYGSDVDNICKGVLDAFKKNDSDVWYINCRKYWAYKGLIIIYQ